MCGGLCIVILENAAGLVDIFVNREKSGLSDFGLSHFDRNHGTHYATREIFSASTGPKIRAQQIRVGRKDELIMS